ncbi:MAG: hypothetical protein CM15mP39_09040 [Synechococcus sp.]|nr:MAG: hypothetical protein CM15mP39_09040 [Synechococcus sp.]
MVLDATKADLNCSNASPIHPQEAQNRGLNQLGVIVQSADTRSAMLGSLGVR